MGASLYMMGMVILGVLFLIGLAFLIHIVIDSDSKVAKILTVLTAIIIATILIVIGLKLGI